MFQWRLILPWYHVDGHMVGQGAGAVVSPQLMKAARAVTAPPSGDLGQGGQKRVMKVAAVYEPQFTLFPQERA